MEKLNQNPLPQEMEPNVYRICHIENEIDLISPCLCSGSMKFVDYNCLRDWMRTSQTEICGI
jgi:E3 ubiquitin-protein ligase MARCH1/8